MVLTIRCSRAFSIGTANVCEIYHNVVSSFTSKFFNVFLLDVTCLATTLFGELSNYCNSVLSVPHSHIRVTKKSIGMKLSKMCKDNFDGLLSVGVEYVNVDTHSFRMGMIPQRLGNHSTS
jgi:hypothetical protein